MVEWFQWLAEWRNSKIVSLLLFFGAFCLIVLYVYTGRHRAKRLESYKHIPFDDDEPVQKGKVDKHHD